MEIAVSRGALRVHWLLTATTSAKRPKGVVCQWDGCRQGGRGRKEWDGAAEAHGRKTKREGAPVSPYIAGHGLWLGLPFEWVLAPGAGAMSYTISDGTRDMKM